MYEGYISAVKEVSGKKAAYRKDFKGHRESVRFLFSGENV